MSLAQILQRAADLDARGDLIEALKLYQLAYQLDRQSELALEGLAMAALSLGRDTLALEFFLKLLILNHENPRAYWGRAQIFFSTGQDARAQSDLERALQLDQPPSDIHLDCAVVFNENALYQRALLTLDALPPQLQAHQDACFERAFALLALQQDHDPRLQKALDGLDPNDEATQMLHAALLQKSQKIPPSPSLLKRLAKDEDLLWRSEILGLLSPPS